MRKRYESNPEFLKKLESFQGGSKASPYKAEGGQFYPDYDFKIPKDGVLGDPKNIVLDAISDPFAMADTRHNLSLNALKESKSPVKIDTASDLIVRDDYLNVIPKNSEVTLLFGPKDYQTHTYLFRGHPSAERLEIAFQKLKKERPDLIVRKRNLVDDEETLKKLLKKNRVTDPVSLDDVKYTRLKGVE